ncbi:uncharacterized protein DUF3787 [Mobilisporobacter senegalensis]|uniref:Uncharacterized protein DUF3787 n=1 Tax=Mobilisporobacter senegalensis TaxID=1329262 RepID=A0A3N1XR11_9FIRM|nr:DUF3787 domain-containing protein [Mobilisporobacter senegalensis]ROR27227.1 uncharacterized protein DUF3787 [Mobilisporobacter senegalensis]
MHENVQKDILSGRNNSRLNSKTPIHKENTAAWNETDKTIKPSNVSIPSQPNVVNAKEWVDDGSRL